MLERGYLVSKDCYTSRLGVRGMMLFRRGLGHVATGYGENITGLDSFIGGKCLPNPSLVITLQVSLGSESRSKYFVLIY